MHLVLELVTGGTVFDCLVEVGAFSEMQAAAVLAPLCSALEHLHANQIVHRDVKLEK